ncbi:hypothetical protein [Leptotrichia sp. oral taxon 847]|uniref:hypothetical protein n=1 Tax=Leptotrichia sp. oral taxon 847 TaxID=1785996 RepID=UPI00076810C7|nr:hypothetical protein [Leptotrichia sp. oral taxon 847]AMD94666.1 hypothetical protein AXF11_03035 [Leptotrichia sp. oral taxon 847]
MNIKKTIFLILSIFAISNIGYSEVQIVGGIIYDDRIFGETPECKVIGYTYFLSVLSLVEKEIAGKNSEETVNRTVYMTVNTNRALKQKGWNKSTSEIENINLYYKNKCRKINMNEIKSTNNTLADKELGYIFLSHFFRYMKGIEMLEY